MTDTTPPDPFHTCFHPHHSNYDETNLPPLLFRIDPPPQVVRPAVDVLVEDGHAVKDDEGLPIKNFSFLPRYISMNPPGWLLEYWMRSDTRLTYKDIKARMTAPVAERPKDNALNMRRERDARGPLALSCWTTRRGQISRVEVERVERWNPDQIRRNTTMTIVYKDGMPDCLKAKTLGSPSAAEIDRVSAGLPPTTQPHYYPLITFLDVCDQDGYYQLHKPSDRVLKTVELFENLSNKALKLGIRSWHSLPQEYLPTSWKPMKNNRVFIYAGDNNDDLIYGYGHPQQPPPQTAGSLPLMHHGYNVDGVDEPTGVEPQQPALYPNPAEPVPETEEPMVDQTTSYGNSTGPDIAATGLGRITRSFTKQNSKSKRDKARESTTKNKQGKWRVTKKKQPRKGKPISGNGNATARGGNASDTVRQPGFFDIVMNRDTDDGDDEEGQGEVEMNSLSDGDADDEGQGDEEDTDMEWDERFD